MSAWKRSRARRAPAHPGAQAAGVEGGRFFPIGNPADLAPDQRAEDGLSLSFTSAPLEGPLEILGFPEAVLRVTSDRPLALVAVRLCDIAPDGASTLVTRGLLNLTHRDGHQTPAPLEPHRPYTVRVRLNSIAHSFPAGHRIRLAISPTYWPWAWPSPVPVTLTVEAGPESRLELPERPPRAEDEALAPFPAPSRPAQRDRPPVPPGENERVIRRDLATGRVELNGDPNYGAGRLEFLDGLWYEERATEAYAITEGDPLSAEVRCRWSIRIGRGDWRTRVNTESVMSASRDAFRLHNRLAAFEGDEQVFSRSWTTDIPRDLV